MKITIEEVMKKIATLNRAVDSIEAMLPEDDISRIDESLCEAIELLQEYRDLILETKVEI